MTLRSVGAIIAALYLTGAQVVAQAPVTIYLGLQTPDGTDSALQESVRDLRREFQRIRRFRVVDQPEHASVLLTVVARHTRLIEDLMTVPGQTVGGRTVSGGSAPIRTPSVTVPVQVEQHVIDAVVRRGSDEHPVSAVDKTTKATVRAIVKDVVALIQGSGESIERQR